MSVLLQPARSRAETAEEILQSLTGCCRTVNETSSASAGHDRGDVYTGSPRFPTTCPWHSSLRLGTGKVTPTGSDGHGGHMTEELGLGYWLARTQFTVTVVRRHELDGRGNGTFRRPVVDVRVAPGAGPDPTGRQRLDLDSVLLSQLALTIDLDERGLIESITTDPDRVAPRAVGADEMAAATPSVTITCDVPADSTAPPLPLEQQWARTNEHLAAHAAQIANNIERLLNNLGHFDADPVMIAQSGKALEVLQAQLESIGAAKRSWMATQAREDERVVRHLTTTDLVWVADDELPLHVANTNIPRAMAEIAELFDVVVVMADGERPETHTTQDQNQSALVLRRSRPVQIGVYARTESGDWHLQDDSALALDVVDTFSQVDLIPLDGSWLRSSSFNLAFHADMSVKSFATSGPGRSGTAASNGGGDERARTPTTRARPRKAMASPGQEGAPMLLEQRSRTDQPRDGGKS